MKKLTIFLTLAAFIIGGVCFHSCEKEEIVEQSASELEMIKTKSAVASVDCQTNCIDPDAPEYFVAHDQIFVGWGGPGKNKFNKTVEVKYYNTLTHFVLQVMSSNGIADVLMDDESIKNFNGTIPPDVWHEFSFELEADWETCDTWGFDLEIAGFGPPTHFDVEYQLIGECVYYTLVLAVNPEGAGSVTGDGEYKEGQEAALTATANEGWEFVNWTDGDDAEISNLAVFTYTMPAYNITLIANFEQEVAGWPRDIVTQVVDVTNPTTGKTWMDRNLGASRAATSSTDAAAYGHLYQWGRAADGHEIRTSGTTTTLSTDDTPGHSNFITTTSSPYDWRSPKNDNLWQGVNGTNNPCPIGYRLPTAAEWYAERASWISNNSYGAFASPLKLPITGVRDYRQFYDGLIHSANSHGFYWSSSMAYTYVGYLPRRLFFESGNANLNEYYRAGGNSVRCIKD